MRRREEKWSDDLWPSSISAVSSADLQSLDDDEFSKLRRLVGRREMRRTKSRTRSKAVVRKLVLKRRVVKRTRFTKQAMLARFQECDILDGFVPNRKKTWLKLSKRKHGVSVALEEFSFIDNPIATFQMLQKVAAAECNAVGFRINFRDRHVKDIGPYLLLGAMRERMAPVIAGGEVTPAVAKVLESVNLSEFLRMKRLGRWHPDDVWPLTLRRRRRAGTSSSKHIASQPTTLEIAADQTVAQVNTWLAQIDPAEELTTFGAGKIKGMIGEILNNAERHGRLGGDGDWITAGFMAKREVTVGGARRHLHICHMSLMNPGRPISETIAGGPSDIRGQIQRYQEKHRKSGLSDEALATVFALQDGISRVDQGDGHPTGGTGMMDIVEFANEVGKIPTPEMQPKVAILSGRAYIRFDAQYNRGQPVGPNNRRLQWFNAENDVIDPPDKEFVMDLPYSFPGTMITLRFVLDGQLAEDEDKKDGDND